MTQLLPDYEVYTAPTIEREREIAAAEPEGMKWWQYTPLGQTTLLAAGAYSEWIPAWAGRQIGQSLYMDDENFELEWGSSLFEELTKDLPENTWHKFGAARSLSHAIHIREEIKQVTRVREYLTNSGVGGTAARFITNMVDPAAILADVATTGIAVPAKITKGARVASATSKGLVRTTGRFAGRTARIGGTTGAVEATLETYRVTQDWDSDERDILYAGMFAAGLGGAVGVISDAVGAFNRGRKSIEFKDIQEQLDLELTRSGRLHYADSHIGAGEATIKQMVIEATTPPAPGVLDGMPELGIRRERRGQLERRGKAALRKMAHDEYGIKGTAKMSKAEIINNIIEQQTVRDWVNYGEVMETAERTAIGTLKRPESTRASVMPARDDYLAAPDVDPNEFIRIRTGAKTPRELLRYYQNKYPVLRGVQLRAVRETGDTGELINEGVAEVAIAKGKLVPNKTTIAVTRDADLITMRHEIEHILDVLHGYNLEGGQRFNRFDHDNFAQDYTYRTMLKDAVRDGKEVDPEDLAMYANEEWAFEEMVRMGTTPNARMAEFAIMAEDIYSRPADKFDLFAYEKLSEARALKEATPGAKGKVATDLDLSGITGITKAMYGVLRFGFAGTMGRNIVPEVRKAGEMLAEDVLPRVKRDANGKWKLTAKNNLSAHEWVKDSFERIMLEYNFRFATHYKRWKARNPDGDLATFSREVTKANRRFNIRKSADPDIRAASEMDRALTELKHAEARRHGVKGFDKFDHDNSHVTRVWSIPALQDAIETHGEKAIYRFMGEAIASNSEVFAKIADPTEQAEWIERVGESFTRAILRTAEFNDHVFANAMSSDMRSKVAGIIRTYAGKKLKESEIDSLARIIAPKQGDKNLISRAKMRMDIDEMFAAKIRNDNFGEIGELRMEDLFENNAQLLFTMYNRQVTGASAASEFYRAMTPAGVAKPFENIDDVAGLLIDRMRAAGRSEREIEKIVTNLRRQHDQLLGKPMFKQDALTTPLRALRAVNLMRVGGQFGAVQMIEGGTLLGEAGVSVMLNSMSGWKGMIRNARTGKLSNETLREFETFIMATDAGWHTNPVLQRLDREDFWIGDGGGKVMTGLRKGERWSMAASGMTGINAFLYRATALAAYAKWGQIAETGKLPSAKRLASLGLDETDARKIIDAMNAEDTPVEFEMGPLGRRVKKFNINEWEDQEAAAMLIGAISKWSRRVIQQNDPGQFATWMSRDWAKNLFQFRSFIIGAYEKQFLHRIAVRDMRAFTSLASTTLAAAAVYMGRTYVDSIGRPDADEYRKERLTLQRIGSAAFQYSGFGSVVTPFLDPVIYAAGGPRGYFSAMRSSQIDTDFLLGNPTVDLVSNLMNTGIEGARAAVPWSDSEFTRGDYYRASRLLPFYRMFGIGNVINALSDNLPEPSDE
jgi:hypothetical protein